MVSQVVLWHGWVRLGAAVARSGATRYDMARDFPNNSASMILTRELAATGIRCRVVRVVRGAATMTYAVACPSADVAAILTPATGERIAHRLGASHVRVQRDGSSILVQVSLPAGDRRPVPLATLPRGDGLRIAIGRDTLGRVVWLDLASNETPHALVCGTTGSGKSETLRTIVAGIARQCDPDDVRLLLIDAKRETFTDFANLAHLARPVVTDATEGADALKDAVRQLDTPRDGRLIIVVDELALLLDETGGPSGQAARAVARLTSLGRSLGVSCIVATQHATADVIGGSIAKANLPCRIVGRVTDARASVLATGRAGLDAHLLSGAGDALMVAGDATRLQVALTGAADVAALATGPNYPSKLDSSAVIQTLPPIAELAAPVHPAHVARPIADAAVQWAIDNGREWPDGSRRPAGVNRIRRQFAPMGQPVAQRVRDTAADIMGYEGYAPSAGYITGEFMPPRVALALG